MDFSKVTLLTKLNKKGTHTIAYCEEYPEIQGIGPTEEQAVANFWRCFNNADQKESHNMTMAKKEESKKVA